MVGDPIHSKGIHGLIFCSTSQLYSRCKIQRKGQSEKNYFFPNVNGVALHA